MITSKALRLTALFLALIINNPAPISAQSNPPGTAEMAFASVQDEVLYIQGGYSDTNYFTDQFYALDLTTDSWSPTNPPWKSLLSPSIYTPSNVRVTISNGMTVTKDQKRLFIWTATGVFWFDRETSLWESKVVDGLSDQGTLYYSYRRAATDGDTGLIYIPSAASGGSKMVVLDPDTITARVVNMPPASLISAVIQVYGWVWSSLRKSFIFTGGEYTSVNNGKTLEYFPSNDTWTELTTFGAKIPAISRHCMVSGYNGRKMVLYGGQEFSAGQASLRGAIYVLDVPSLTWTQGPNVPSAFISADMACTITGSNFISWGGSYSTANRDFLRTPAIFNNESMTWKDQFTKEAIPTVPTDPSDSSGAGNTVAIAVGCAGAVVVLLLVGLLFWIRCRRANASAATTTTYTTVLPDPDTDAAYGGPAVVTSSLPTTPMSTNAPFMNKPFNNSTGVVSKGVYGHNPQLHAYGASNELSPFTMRGPPTVHTLQEWSPQRDEVVYQDVIIDDTTRRNPQLGGPTTNSSFY